MRRDWRIDPRQVGSTAMLTRGSKRESGPTEASLAKLIDRIVDSEVFRAAPALRKLLVFLWNQRTLVISEYAIAIEALERAQDFEPKTDASVRVQIARLRA